MARANRTPDVNLNLNVRGMSHSATVAINERCDALLGQGQEVFKLGLGQSPFPVPSPVVEELRANAHQKAYLPVAGLPELRSAVAEYHRRRTGIAARSDDVLVGPGSKELMFLLQLVYYGDLVVPTPSWVSYAPQAHIIGRRISWLPTDPATGWRITPQTLLDLGEPDPGRPRIVILNYPNNPTGSTYTLNELRELAAVARKLRFVLLSDEIYGELHFRNQHVSIARFYPEGTIVSSGLSKWCGAGGWRLGTFLFPHTLSWLRDAMAAVASETFTSTSAPIQYAAVRAFEGGTRIEQYLWSVRRILGALAKWSWRHLSDLGVSVERPAGAFYLFPDFTPFADRIRAAGIKTSAQLCERLLTDAGVAILPGSNFGRPADELTARISIVDFDGARAIAGADQVSRSEALGDDFLQIYCPNVLRAIKRIGQWISEIDG